MVQITNVFDRAVSLLAGQFQGTLPNDELTNLQKLIKVFCSEIQSIEDQNNILKTQRFLDSALGVQLDGLGQILGLERLAGESDDDYRERLQFQIFINRSNGTPEEVISVLKFLTKATKIWYHEYYPAAYQMMTNGLNFPDPPEQLVQAIHDVSPSAVQYVPITAIYDFNPPFSFSTDPIEELFFVAPEPTDPSILAQLEVTDGIDIFFLEINRGQVANPDFGGGFAEADSMGNIIETTSIGAGMFAEVIMFNGSQPV